jgi:hypothetical protein
MSARWQDEYLRMIADCEKRESKLTDWERTFIDSVAHWLANGSGLSGKQIERLEEIWERVTAKG